MNIESPKDLACLYFKWHFQSDLKRVKVTAGNWKGVCASEYSKEAKNRRNKDDCSLVFEGK